MRRLDLNLSKWGARMRLGIGVLAVLTLVTGLVSCADSPVRPPPDPADLARVPMNVAAGVPVSTVVVEIAGSGIATPLTYNLTVRDGVASGTASVPVGSERVFTARAYDDGGVHTHRGSRTTNVAKGTNPTVSIALTAVAGDQPIGISLGSARVTVAPAGATSTVGDTIRLSATGIDASGDTIMADVRWVSLTPKLAVVDSGGLVTALDIGTARISATYAGAAATALITISGTSSPVAYAYVANAGSNSISVIDTRTRSVTGAIPTGEFPQGIAVSPDAQWAYIANSGSPTLSVISTATHSLWGHPIDISHGAPGYYSRRTVAFSRDGAHAYITDERQDALLVVNASMRHARPEKIQIGSPPYAVSVSPDGRSIYVVNNADNQVTAIDARTKLIIATISVGIRPRDIAVSPDGVYAFVTNSESSTVGVIDLRTYSVTDSIEVGAYPHGVVFSSDGGRAYVSNFGPASNSVSVIDVASRSVIGTIPVGLNPAGIVLTPDDHARQSEASGSVSVIETETNTVVATIPVEARPYNIAVVVSPR